MKKTIALIFFSVVFSGQALSYQILNIKDEEQILKAQDLSLKIKELSKEFNSCILSENCVLSESKEYNEIKLEITKILKENNEWDDRVISFKNKEDKTEIIKIKYLKEILLK